MDITTNMYSLKRRACSNHWLAKQFAVNVIHDANDARAMDSILRFVQNVLDIGVANNAKTNAQLITMRTKFIANVMNAIQNVEDVPDPDQKIVCHAAISRYMKVIQAIIQRHSTVQQHAQRNIHTKCIR